MADFSKNVAAWAGATRQQVRRVAIGAVENFVTEAVERAPRDLGNLANAVVVKLNSAPTIEPTVEDAVAAANASKGVLSAQFEVGDVVHVGFVVSYAFRQEYGFVGTDSLGRTYNQGPRPFVRPSAQNWKQHVADAVAVEKSRGSR